MLNNNPLFTTGERRAAVLAVLSAVVLTLSMVVLEPVLHLPQGLWDAKPMAQTLSNVVDARPIP